MKRKSFFDNGLMIIAAVAIILSIVMAVEAFENGRQFDYSLRDVDSSRRSSNNEYLRIRDSLATAIGCEETQLSDLGVSQFITTVGFTKVRAAGTCPAPARSGNVEKKESCYLSLAGYKISNESAFYLEGSKSMITFGQQDGRNVAKEISVRYVKPAPGFRNPQFGYVLVPTAERLYYTLNLAMIFGNALVVLVLSYAIVRTLRIILRISKGRVFSHQNTRDILVAGRVFMALAIMPLFLQLIFYYVFSKEIPAQITPAYAQVLWDNKIYFIIGFIMLLLAKAFEKGHRLQKENLSII